MRNSYIRDSIASKLYNTNISRISLIFQNYNISNNITNIIWQIDDGRLGPRKQPPREIILLDCYRMVTKSK